MKKTILLYTLSAFLSVAAHAEDKSIIKDGELSVSERELVSIIHSMPDKDRRKAAEDVSARRDYLNQIVAVKKMAREVDQVSVEKDPEFYWKVRSSLEGFKVRMLTERFNKELKIPDMSELAKERYLLYKDRYAKVPESRESSHIFLRCIKAEKCDFEARYKEAEKIINKRKAGFNFESLVEEYSEDPSSKARYGKLEKPVFDGSKHFSKEYVKNLFQLKKAKDYTKTPVKTEFGYHVIRLDKIIPPYYKSFEEVEKMILADLEKEFRTLSVEVYKQSFGIDGDTYIDEKSVDEIFDSVKVDKP